MYVVDVDGAGPRLEAIHRSAEGVPEDPERILDELFTTAPGPDDPVALARAVAEAGDAVGLWRHEAGALLLRPRPAAWSHPTWPPARSLRWRSLPSAVVKHLVAPVLGLRSVAPRSDPARAAADQRGRPGTGLLVLPPVDASTVLDLAARGEPMPAKTTSFRPKPRTGLIMRRLDG